MAPKLRITLRITHNNAALRQRLQGIATTGINRAADYLVSELRKVVSTPSPGGANRHNIDAGKPPYARTGEGMRSIRRTATGRISMYAYMAYLDFGTRRIRPRPWYHVTIERLRSEITRRAVQ